MKRGDAFRKLRTICQRLDGTPIVDHLEAHPTPWPGPRPEEELEQTQAAWEARSDEERAEHVAQVLAALQAREDDL